MKELDLSKLSARERQILDILYAEGEASAAGVRDRLPDAPGYSAVRTLLRILEDKGYAHHVQDGPRYIYKPTLAREKARTSALSRVLRTFFDGSREQAVAALLDQDHLSPEEHARLRRLIDEAREKGTDR